MVDRMPVRLPQQCRATIATRDGGLRWCEHTVTLPNDALCARHEFDCQRLAIMAERRHRALVVKNLLNRAPPGRENVHRVVSGWRDIYEQYEWMTYPILEDAFLGLYAREWPGVGLEDMPNNLRQFWAEFIRPEHVPPTWWELIVPPAPATDLARLALDHQNVHTGAVASQTRKGEESLLAVKTNGQNTMSNVLLAFAQRSESARDVLAIVSDMEKWYSTPDVRAPGDRLYARVLDGLWTTMMRKSVNVTQELVMRLWQEAGESVGMCAEGHISRLVNVMVGYDDAFEPPTSKAELIQYKMASIAGMNVSTEEKIKQAREFLDRAGMTKEAQAAWLDALA